MEKGMRSRLDPTGPFRLTRRTAGGVAGAAPVLDQAQRAVVAHRNGPLLVLAGPGTGKTTTLVEAVLDRTGGPDALAPEQILVLTFSRAAAAELRDRIGIRLAQAARDAQAAQGGQADESVAQATVQATVQSAAASAAPRRDRAAGVPTATTFHSFCFALLGQYQNYDLFPELPRLLSGPEQDVVIRDLVKSTVGPGRWGDGPGGWPQALRAALGTRGFAEELRAVLLRSTELGLLPPDLAGFAERAGRPDWRAAARFFEEYLDVADLRGVLDYAELVHRAVLLAETDEVRDALRRRFRAVFVDEYQDTDPAQVRLLRALAGDGRDLIVVGDPDQAIYAFRGADVNGILEFPRQFRRPDGGEAQISVLDTSRRAGPVLLRASRELARRMPIARLPVSEVRRHRDLTAHGAGTGVGGRAEGTASPAFGDGRVEVATYADSGSELAAAADLLRRAHLERAVPWEEMAVLVRSGTQLADVRRALTAVNVPVEVLGDDLPLAQEPAVAALLAPLRCAADRSALTKDAARALLTGPLGGMDGAGLRRLGRALRDQERAALAVRRRGREEDVRHSAVHLVPRGYVPPDDVRDAESAGDHSAGDGADLRLDGQGPDAWPAGYALVRPADELIREALADPRLLLMIDAQIAGPALTISRLLQRAEQALSAGGAVQDALWILWHGDPEGRPRLRTGWPERLRRAAERGGPAGRLADRDLDALITLFALAERAGNHTGRAGVIDFISALQPQAIAADTLADKASRGGAVQIATAHKSKGLQWRVVVVAAVQEGLWPDLRRRGSLLEADRIGPTGLTEPLSPTALLAEERRLFYVAVTRAREHLVVSAVLNDDDDGEQPSRFLRELGVEPESVGHRRRRPLNPSALIADLRRAATDPVAPAAVRDAAADRLARLATATDADGRALFPSADPAHWWGLYDYTDNQTPITDPDGPVPLSPSSVAALDSCALKWFLERRAGAQEQTTQSLAFGRVFHALAEEVALGQTKAEINVLMDRLDRVWDALPFDARWKSEQERRAARRALERFLHWHAETALRGREVLAVEREFTETLSVGGVPVRLNGTMDRIEADAEGRLYVVDFKTGKRPKSARDAAQDPQLGAYQVLIRAEGYLGGQVARAELVYPRDEKEAAGPTVVAQPALAESADPNWAEDLIAGVARRVLDERFFAYGDEQKDCRGCRLRTACPKRPEGRELPL